MKTCNELNFSFIIADDKSVFFQEIFVLVFAKIKCIVLSKFITRFIMSLRYLNFIFH